LGEETHSLKIVIAGLPKSGTTALYSRVKNSVPADAWCLFENGRYSPPPTGQPPGWIVAKELVTPNESGKHGFRVDYDSYECFDRKLYIVRDPRDNLISSFLYYAAMDTDLYDHRRRLGRLLALLETKEREPARVSMLQLLDLMTELDHSTVRFVDVFLARQAVSEQFLERYPNYHTVSYTDLVDDNLESVEAYLGFRLTGSSRVDTEYARVERTFGYGDWKNWFTAADVAFFGPLLDSAVRRSGCDDEWELSESPHITAEVGSSYVRRVAQERFQWDRARVCDRRTRRLKALRHPIDAIRRRVARTGNRSTESL
jgi:hypothetical protein